MSIRAIAYDFGTFVMFSIFESITIVFTKQSNFRVFWSNSRRNHANQQSKNIRKFVQNWSSSRGKRF